MGHTSVDARELSTELENSGNTALDSESYGYNLAGQRTTETNTAGDYRNYTYDNEGELLSAIGKEMGGVTNRLMEQLGYGYDGAGNLNCRTNNAMLQTFNVNSLNELTTTTNGRSLTVEGMTTSIATNVTVNATKAALYRDATFALGGFTIASGNNTYTAIAKDSYNRLATNISTVNLPVTNIYSYDLNGNLTNDSNRSFAYDDENELISVWVASAWSNHFVYDGKMRKRIERDYAYLSGSWIETNETHYIYDGNVVVQERDQNNTPKVTYTRGNDLSGKLQGAGGIGGLLARTDNSKFLMGDSFATAYYHSDANGNVTYLLYNNQTEAAKYLYDPYGNLLGLNGPLASANHYRFSSKEWNDNEGLYYYLYRFYDPELQRWLNRDPIREWGGWNLFDFDYNRPQNLVDIYGLDINDPPPVVFDPPLGLPPANPLPEQNREMDQYEKCMLGCLGESGTSAATTHAILDILQEMELIGEEAVPPAAIAAAGLDACKLQKCSNNCMQKMKLPPFGYLPHKMPDGTWSNYWPDPDPPFHF